MNANCLLTGASTRMSNNSNNNSQSRIGGGSRGALPSAAHQQPQLKVAGSRISAAAYGVNTNNAILMSCGSSHLVDNDQLDTAFDQDFAAGNDINMSLNDRSLSLGGGLNDPQLHFNQDGQGQAIMLQGGQAQGQGFQSQNASSIMQHNYSMNNDFGFIDEPSAIEAQLDRISSDEIQPLHAPHQSQTSQSTPVQIDQYAPHQQPAKQPPQPLMPTMATRTNEGVLASVCGKDALTEVNSLRHVLTQLQQALGQQVHPQIQGMLNAALKHQSNLQETIQMQKLSQNSWRKAFKEKVRVKLSEFKEQKKHELQKAEELKFKQQINEFELHERVSSLEQAYSRQEEEINKQANANEILKFEKMKLIQQHSKRLTQIESALGKIQIQKAPVNRHPTNDAKGPAQAAVADRRHARGHSVAEVSSAFSRSDNQLGPEGKKSKKPMRQPPDSQSDKKRKGEDLSRSFCTGQQRLDSLENQNNQSSSALLLQAQVSKSNASVGTQLCNLQNLIREFKHLSDQQRREEVQINDFQVPVDRKRGSSGEVIDQSGKQPSVSDCDFVNPQQQRLIMNNFFTSMGDASEANTKNNQSSNDVGNRAIIMGGSKDSASHEDRDTALGDLAQQLNDTSFFAGPGGLASDIVLPDNMNFFSRGHDEAIEFHPNQKEDSASKVRQIEDDMACFVDEDMLLSGFDESKQLQAKKKKPDLNEVLDSDDKEVEDLFRDSSADSVADSFKRQLNAKSQLGHCNDLTAKQHKSKSRVRDVDLDDLMQASVATDFKPEEKRQQDQDVTNFSKDDFLNEGVLIMNEADLSPVPNKSSEKMNFLENPIMDFNPERSKLSSGLNKFGKSSQKNHQNEAEISLALPDLSAIVSEKPDNCEPELVADKVEKFFNDVGSEDDQNLADLNRKLMPSFIINVGNRQIKMPRLDLQRVLQMYDQNPFLGNIKTQTNQSLETDTILETHKDMKGVDASQTSGGSFLNETGSKQVQSECQIESVKSKQKESKSESDANMLDYLNKCDQAISAIIEDAPFDGDDDNIEVRDDILVQKKETTIHTIATKVAVAKVDISNKNQNMLDSLREELQKEEADNHQQIIDHNQIQIQELVEQNYTTVAHQSQFQKQEDHTIKGSPTANSMPFELRDSFKSKLTDSNKMRQSSVVTVTYAHHHNNEKRSLSTVGQKMRQNSSVEERNEGAPNNQLHSLMQKNDFTMSQKEFDKKSQMMRLSELDSVSNHLHNKSQKEEVTRTQKIGQIPAANKIGGVDGLQERNRAPSENQALERQQQYQQKDSSDNGGKLLSPHTMVTNGTDSIVGSLQTQSALGDKSRLSAPATIPSKSSQHQQRAQQIVRESAYMTEVVKEVEDDDSKILSVNNSSSKLVSNDETEQSIQMLAYNSAYPHTTKNIRQLKSHYSSQKQSASGSQQQHQQQPVVQQNKKTKVSIQRVQHHAEMSSLIKNQKTSSSSIQRLKIVKKVSVNSAAVPGGGNSEQSKREVLSSNSVERPSVGGNSSISLIEQSRIARVNASSVNRDYASVGGTKVSHNQQESSNPRLSINTRKSKPITVSFKNIVKASMQKRKASNAAAATDNEESSVQRDDSEKPGSVINLQRIALNPAVAPGSSSKQGKISVASKGGEGKTLNITVMRNSRPNHKEHADSNIVKKQILKLNNNQANNSVEETRDGSIIFVHNTSNATGSKQGGRKHTVERVSNPPAAATVNNQSSYNNQNHNKVAHQQYQGQNRRVPSPSITVEGVSSTENGSNLDDKQQHNSVNTVGKRPSSKSKTKMLIAAHQIKQRKLSIGSSNAAATLLKQNNQNNNSNRNTLQQQEGQESSQKLINAKRSDVAASGSRASHTEASKATSPASPRRLSNKSTTKVTSEQQNHQTAVIKHQKGAAGGEQPQPQVTKGTKAVKKGSIICLKRREAAVTEGSQHLTSSKHLATNKVGERVPSVGADGNQSSKRSQQTSDAPNLKIKRMTKSTTNSKTTGGGRQQARGGSNRPATVIRCQDNTVMQQHHQYASVNQTTVDQGFGHENSLVRELHGNQSNTILGDLSLLSKIGGDSKGQIMVIPNMSYGTSGQSTGKPTNILINQQNQQQQSSQQNLPSGMFQLYEGPSMSNSFQVAGDAKSAAGGKRIGLSRGSIEITQNQVNQSQVVAASSSNFVMPAKETTVMASQASGMQISQKAMKIISTQKSKISGAQRQVQMEWKTSGMQQSTNLQVGKHRHSAAPTTDPLANKHQGY